MLRRDRPAPAAVLLTAALLAPLGVACRRTTSLPRLERFPAAEGAVFPAKLGRITRPAIRLPADGALRWRVELTDDARLVFAAGATDRALEVTSFELQVEAAGRSAYRQVFPLSRDHWFPCSVPLPGRGKTDVVIRAR